MSKIIKKGITSDAVDGSKVKLLNNQTLRARNAADSADVDLLKLNASDQLEFSILPEFGGSPLATQSSVSSTFIDKFTLSPTDISNGFVTLSGSPTTPSDTILDVVGGITQDYSIDFTVSGSTLSWSSLGLDGVLSSGDKLIVQFN